MSAPHEHGGNIFAIARSLGLPPEAILDFSASINPLGMAPGVASALAASLPNLLHYPDKGAVELKERIASYHGLAPEEVAVGNGSTELIHLLPRLVAGAGKRALIVAPAFAEYAAALERAGWEIEYFHLTKEDGFALDAARLKERLALGYDLLFLCNPANPTGILTPAETIWDVIRLCRASGTFLALDEAFMDFCEEASAKELVRGVPNVLLLRSMTKFFAIPGLRLGYALGAAETIASLAALQDPWSVNTAAQVAGVASLADEDYRTRTRKLVAGERAFLAGELARYPQLRVYPGAANYLLAEILSGGTAKDLRGYLMPRGILIRDCANFEGLDGRFFRVAVRLREENLKLLEGIGTFLSKRY
ncbi:threonine-phosphate decarboxylase CobD [Geomonas sp. Red32]|uniref:threonine-phosphate decarboxylase CobD n=1 Tax=Geomonas sp. Red32 TaxID=2912856 RepID=UPI00202CB8A6|nr:threonine-phosphate decarboxylase CobD [Geomonas sp. Red32]MCM0083990.1 threonine-phosphate decarboxylase CobD [Geomonas sp. Red32]